MQTTIERIQSDVKEWSLENFGQQVSTTKGCRLSTMLNEGRIHDRVRDQLSTHEDITLPIVLGSLAPLLGIVEELGEHQQAYLDDNDVEMHDALGDIGIYLCDYAAREDVRLCSFFPKEIPGRWQWLNPPREEDYCIRHLIAAVGRLCHVTLKRHQGIRGFDKYNHYEKKRNKAIQSIVWCLFDISNARIGIIIEQTWDGIVAKRNWKKEKEDGK